MKRVNHLFEPVVDRSNLAYAFWKASRGRRHRAEIRQFATNLDARLTDIRRRWLGGTYRFGQSHQFTIRDPKRRLITAPIFEERVVQHGIMNLCEPIFERRYIDDSYACRRGKGRDACLDRAVGFSRRWSHVVHLDIRGYFDSIDHEVLMRQLERLIKDGRLLDVFRKVLQSYVGSGRCGLPIGTLCSQHLANLYLSPLDRWIKEELRAPGYLRYMDDFVLWGPDSGRLNRWVQELSTWLDDRLRLKLKFLTPSRSVQRGFDFLGHRIFPGRMTLNRRSRRRYRRRLRDLELGVAGGTLTAAEFQTRVTALTAFVARSGVQSWGFRTTAIAWALATVQTHRPRWMATSAEDG